MWRGHAISFYKGILPKIQRIFGDKTVFTITFDKMLEFVSFSLRIARFLQLVQQIPISAILLALWRYGLWPYCHNMALWPHVSYLHHYGQYGRLRNKHQNCGYFGGKRNRFKHAIKSYSENRFVSKIPLYFRQNPFIKKNRMAPGHMCRSNPEKKSGGSLGIQTALEKLPN